MKTFDSAQAAYILAANRAMACVAAATAVYHSSADNSASQAIMRAADVAYEEEMRAACDAHARTIFEIDAARETAKFQHLYELRRYGK